ncbi:MAG: HpcH/HpaI aldolase/citrate lyase family protein [Paracoccaceae bacterium]
MDAVARPFRSVLYIPGSNARALDKARGLPADAIIFDLEDAVAPEAKEAARDQLAATLAEGGYGPRTRIARVNGLTTPWGAADIAAMRGADAILLPKVNGVADVAAAAALAPDTPLWAMIETPLGVLNAAAIAAHPAMQGFVLGTNDLAKDIGCRTGGDRMALMTSLQMALLGARAAGIVSVDGVYNAFRDEDGLRAECEQGRALGFDGKTLIHPAQLAVANAVFAPDPAELDLARRQIEAFEAAEAAGQGVAVLEGEIVENLHVAVARALIARAEVIARMEKDAKS